MNKKLYLIYSILLLIALATMAALWLFNRRRQAAVPRDYPEIEKEGVMRLVTEYNSIGYYIDGDTVGGFQYELGNAIAGLAGLQIETHLEMSLENSFRGLRENRYDVIARNIPVTSADRNEFLFTDPVVLNRQVLVQRTAAAHGDTLPLRNQLDLAGKTLYIPKDSPGKIRLENLQHEIGDTIYIREEPLYSSEQLIILVAKGEIDYAVCDRKIAENAQKQFPEIDIDTDISFTQLQAWAVRKDSPRLRDSLNSWFRRLRDNGIYDRIYQRYYYPQK